MTKLVGTKRGSKGDEIEVGLGGRETKRRKRKEKVGQSGGRGNYTGTRGRKTR